MGTRRSKHDQGRKPRRKDLGTEVCKAIWDTPNFQKEPEPTVDEVLAAPAFVEFAPGERYRLNQRLNWSEADKVRLQVLANAGINPTIAANTLGREEKSIAYKARDMGIFLPPAWSAFLPKPKYIARPREKRILLNYPFSIRVDQERDSDLMAVNALVPKTIPDHMRGDICQEILLAVYEGKVNLETLRKRPDLVRQQIAAWRNRNLEHGGYGIVQFDPYGDDERSIEEQIAAKADWDRSQRSETLSRWEAMAVGITPATQLDEVYRKEIHDERMAYAENGVVLHIDEIERRLSSGERISRKRSLVPDRLKIARFVVDCGFELCNPMDLNAAYMGEGHQVYYNGQSYNKVELPSLQTQYVRFKIPGSAIRPLTIRVSDHAAKASSDHDLDTHKLGMEGVMNVLEELSDDVGKYEKVYSRWGNMPDLLNNGLEGFSDVA